MTEVKWFTGGSRLNRWVPPVLLMVALTVGSSIPGTNLPAAPMIGFDKLVHATAFFFLGGLLARALGPRALRSLVLAWFLASLFGVVDEFHQYFVPRRQPDPFDVLADTVGAFLGVALLGITATAAARMRKESHGDTANFSRQDPGRR